MRKKLMSPVWIVALDILAIGAALIVYALFHHVLPQKGDGLNQSIVSIGAPAATATAEPAAGPTLEPEATPTPTPEPSPTPTPAPGDFSATFPDYDTSVGLDALYSYQTDEKRIVVYSGKMHDAVYYVADVWIRDIQYFRTGLAGGEYARGIYDSTLNIANANGALVAISGDYYGSRSTGVVIRNGVLHRDSITADVCVLYADGVMEACYQKAFDLEAAIARGAYQAWSFGPTLLKNGVPPEKYQHADIAERHPRSAIGYFEPGHYCLVVIDGRQSDYSRGMSFVQMSELFISLGCSDAYNLDGGQTAVMAAGGAVINRPYKNGRVVSDIVYF